MDRDAAAVAKDERVPPPRYVCSRRRRRRPRRRHLMMVFARAFDDGVCSASFDDCVCSGVAARGRVRNLVHARGAIWGGASAAPRPGASSPVGGTDAAGFGAVSVLSTAGAAETGAACHSIEAVFCLSRASLLRPGAPPIRAAALLRAGSSSAHTIAEAGAPSTDLCKS